MKVLFIILSLIFSSDIIAQNKVCFEYDLSGNRTSRNINCDKSTPATPAKSVVIDSMPNKQALTANLPGEMKITLYPNPTKGQLTIEVTNLPSDTKGEIILSDLTGKLIFKQNTIQATNLLDISSQSKGLYILKFRAGEKLAEWKVIKQ